MSVMLYPCMLCVALLMCLFVLCVACLTVFVNCLLKQFAMCLGVVAILLLIVIEVFSVCGGALLDRPCMVFQRVCCCTCDPNERLSAPSICLVCVFVCRKLSPHLEVCFVNRGVCALLMLFLCVILHTMSSGKSLQLLCILPFGMLCLSAISMMFVKICCQCVCGGYGGLSESGPCVFCKLCPVCFLVVGQGPSVLL